MNALWCVCVCVVWRVEGGGRKGHTTTRDEDDAKGNRA
jgi:hypothetical protein